MVLAQVELVDSDAEQEYTPTNENLARVGLKETGDNSWSHSMTNETIIQRVVSHHIFRNSRVSIAALCVCGIDSLLALSDATLEYCGRPYIQVLVFSMVNINIPIRQKHSSYCGACELLWSG